MWFSLVSILRGIEKYGTVVACVPLTASRQCGGEKFLQNKCNTNNFVLHVLYVAFPLYSIFLFLNTILTNSPETITGSSKLTEYLGVWCVYGALVLSDAVIRFAGLLFLSDLTTILSCFRMQRKFLDVDGNETSDFFALVSAVITTILVISFGIAIAILDLHSVYQPEFYLTMIPSKDKHLFRVLYMISTLCFLLSYWFAWLFVIFESSYLISWIRNHSVDCRNTALRSVSTPQDISDLRLEFDSIKKAFHGFNRIGGACCFALLLSSTLLLIKFLSRISSPGTSQVSLHHGTEFFCYLLPVGIIIIAVAGTRMMSAVRLVNKTTKMFAAV